MKMKKNLMEDKGTNRCRDPTSHWGVYCSAIKLQLYNTWYGVQASERGQAVRGFYDLK